LPGSTGIKANGDKCQKHGVSIEEIESLFAGTVLVSPSPKRSVKEERLIAFGTTARGRKLLVVVTLRHKGAESFLRPISARYMHKKEAAYYEKEAPKTEE
jgi:hypothetical protein